MAMTLDYFFLGFGVHLVSEDDDALLYLGIQKGMLDWKEKSETWDESLRSETLTTVFLTTF